jgi:IrrE N-terminal-like domain
MNSEQPFSTHPSVLSIKTGFDPVVTITTRARELVLEAVEKGWSGPPYDPFQLADILKIPTVARDDVADARLVSAGTPGVQIEFNPNRPRGRTRFSIAHEIAHTLFPDHAAQVRNRLHQGEMRADDWQLELLCNVAAAELLMPVGTDENLENESLSIDNILRLRSTYDVSTEAILLRMARVTRECCAVFAAAPAQPNTSPVAYRLDYVRGSRSWDLDLPGTGGIPIGAPLSQCTAVGYTAKGLVDWSPQHPIRLECVGIPPFPGDILPRVAGVLRPRDDTDAKYSARVVTLFGSALEPRQDGPSIIAFVVNDATPIWGGGFALQVRRKWPKVQDIFSLWAEGNRAEFVLGNICPIDTTTPGLLAVPLIAQRGWGPSSKARLRYIALKACLTKLASLARDQGMSVHIPMIGTGQAGGRWDIIKELIDEALVTIGLKVTVYSLPGAQPNRELQPSLPLLAQRA